MFFHYQTQPLPNPLSWYFHHLPPVYHKTEVLFTHFSELVVPFFYFVAGPVGWAAAGIAVFFQGMLILSGNLSWLNYITIVIAIACFDDRAIGRFARVPEPRPMGTFRRRVIVGLVAFIAVLSVRPAVNLLSPHQAMNASFEPLHLCNTYGAFGTITRDRDEIVVQGTADEDPRDARWLDYEFKGKPGDPSRAPCVVSPYHWKLDWQMWFAAMNDFRYHPWILNLMNKLLRNDRETLSLLAKNPFPNVPPRYIRMVLCRYRFTTPQERKETGDWWHVEPIRLYLPPTSLEMPNFRKIVSRMGWDD
jgi:hypothetical protein